ncbi:NapC/NirT family cytochrome c [Pleionea sediminis]|uniref:NapC/NirT family cytochrome c n=1 Tax=Pleionea sediminis TaxID=2569479 RepID=UPI001186F304|nr:NapC/NirT family cytochrome c [Pleionea sediminis]
MKQKIITWWRCLWAPTQIKWFVGIPVGGFLAFLFGILFWGGFNWGAESTNSMAFCISCHEMKSTVYLELKDTKHFKNRVGIQATCADCHVPKDWFPKMVRKVKSTRELYHKVMGTIDTPEKFEAHRLELAERVWAEMRENNSLECRNCHSYSAMDISLQDRQAQRRHTQEWYEKNGDTCIDCHKGVAHKLPEGY